MANLSNGDYWVGGNGNIYQYVNGKGVVNRGPAIKNYGNGFDAKLGSSTGRQIADPNPPTGNTGVLAASTGAPGNPNGGGGGGSGAPRVDKSNSIALQMAGLGAVDSQLGAGLGSIDRSLAGLLGQYDTEAGSNEKNYNTQSVTNQNNLQKNKQTSLVNAAQGRQGLYGTLASLGALNGDGINLANRSVQKGANDDLSGAADNYAGNQEQLDTAIGTFRQEDKMRRENANTAADNARTNARGEAAKSRMSFLTNLSNDYAAMGDAGTAKRYATEASSLYPEVARTSIPNSNIAYSGAAFTPGTLADYMAGADSTVVSATPTQPGQSSTPGLVALPVKKKQLQPA